MKGSALLSPNYKRSPSSIFNRSDRKQIFHTCCDSDRKAANARETFCNYPPVTHLLGTAVQAYFAVALTLVIIASPTVAQDNGSQTKTVPASNSTANAQPTADNPMLGLAPPTGAVVLFDGSNFDAWKPFSWQWINPKDNQKEIQWEIKDDASFEIALEFNGKRRQQTLSTKQTFGKYRLHLEFQLPAEGTGNSGVFFGPLYELQILNSSEKEKIGLSDCGAIYQVRVPDVNAGLGPNVWQTVDLEYQPAKIRANGYMTETGSARVTIRLNGQLIHDDVQLSLRRNKYGAFPEERTSAIILQDHNSPVKFRNIWVVEK